jgi:hypothetical protein
VLAYQKPTTLQNQHTATRLHIDTVQYHLGQNSKYKNK